MGEFVPWLWRCEQVYNKKVAATEVVQDWKVSESNAHLDPIHKRQSVMTLMGPVKSLPVPVPVPDSPTNTTSSTKGIPMMVRAQTSHPLDPLLAAEISVAVAIVRAAGATPEVRYTIRSVEVVLEEPQKQVVA